jgi:hypothetical protein
MIRPAMAQVRTDGHATAKTRLAAEIDVHISKRANPRY